MCLLILLRGFDPEYPLFIASNRDEHRDRKASPPGLWVGRRRRALAPRDRRAGGTWIGVNDLGMFAALTNAPGKTHPNAFTRGLLPLQALDQDSPEAAAHEVSLAVSSRGPYDPFQLLIADATHLYRVAHDGETTLSEPLAGPAIVATNLHPPNALDLPLAAPCRPGLTAAQRLDALAPVLLDPGGPNRHPVLKRGDTYGTVSSALLAIHATDPRRLHFRYAPGPPDQTTYRNYSNLSRRLVEH